MKKTLTKSVLLLMTALTVFGLYIVWADPLGYSGKAIILAQDTTLAVVRGKVFVNDQPVSKTQTLQSGDQIQISKNGMAEIVYFDDTITRLDGGTVASIETLEDAQYNLGEGKIVMHLEKGTAWSNVQPQTSPNFSFSVNTASVHALIRGSVLNVSTDGDCMNTIMALEHTTEIEYNNESADLIEGHKAEIRDTKACGDETEEAIEGIQIEPFETGDFATQWYRINQKADEKHLKHVQQKIETYKKQRMGAPPGTLGAKVKHLHDKITLATAGKDQWREELQIAERTLLESENYLKKNQTIEAQKAMEQYQRVIRDLAKNKSNIHQIQTSIQATQKLIRHTLPDEKTYEVKNLLDDLQTDISNLEKKLTLKAYQLQKKILELHDLQKKGNLNQSHLEQFRNWVLKNLKNHPEMEPFLKIQLQKSPYLEAISKRYYPAENKQKSLKKLFHADKNILPLINQLNPSDNQKPEKILPKDKGKDQKPALPKVTPTPVKPKEKVDIRLRNQINTEPEAEPEIEPEDNSNPTIEDQIRLEREAEIAARIERIRQMETLRKQAEEKARLQN